MRRLLIRPGAIGDCILSFPALQSLRTHYTEIWVPTPVVPLIDFADCAHSIARTGLDLVGIGDLPMDPQLRDRLLSFDQIVSWYGTNRDEFRSALESLGIPCRFYPALPPEGSHTHATDFFCQQVGCSVGLMPSIRIDAASSRKTVVIHPFSGGASKNWPLPLYQEFAEQVGGQVEWLAGPEESVSGARHFDNLRELAQWIGGTQVYVGNDSGITHLAAATGVPTISLFRATSPAVWAPRGRRVTVLQQSNLTVAALLEAVHARIHC